MYIVQCIRFKKVESKNITSVQIYLYEIEKNMRDVVQTLLLGTLGLWGHAELCSGGDIADERVSALHGLACGKSKFFFLRYEKKI